MQNWYFIATYVLAVIAVFGFFMSICSSKKSSKTMNSIVKSLTAFVEPVIKYSNIRFQPDPPQINCEHPPNLINVTYRNTSNIPIKLSIESLEILYGDKPIYSGPKSNPPNEPSLLSPGEPWGLTQSIDKAVQSTMVNKTNMFLPPFIKLNFKAKISTLDDQKKYFVHLEHQIGFDCTNYTIGNVTNLRESYIKITE